MKILIMDFLMRARIDKAQQHQEAERRRSQMAKAAIQITEVTITRVMVLEVHTVH
jgi:hypothetical protein